MHRTPVERYISRVGAANHQSTASNNLVQWNDNSYEAVQTYHTWKYYYFCHVIFQHPASPARASQCPFFPPPLSPRKALAGYTHCSPLLIPCLSHFTSLLFRPNTAPTSTWAPLLKIEAAACNSPHPQTTDDEAGALPADPPITGWVSQHRQLQLWVCDQHHHPLRKSKKQQMRSTSSYTLDCANAWSLTPCLLLVWSSFASQLIMLLDLMQAKESRLQLPQLREPKLS